MKFPRNNGRPQIWLEETKRDRYDGGIYTLIRIFYPDGTSEYLSMNEYFDNGDYIVRVAGDWQSSTDNAWFPWDLYERRKEETTATFLGYL